MERNAQLLDHAHRLSKMAEWIETAVAVEVRFPFDWKGAQNYVIPAFVVLAKVGRANRDSGAEVVGAEGAGVDGLDAAGVVGGGVVSETVAVVVAAHDATVLAQALAAFLNFCYDNFIKRF